MAQGTQFNNNNNNCTIDNLVNQINGDQILGDSVNGDEPNIVHGNQQNNQFNIQNDNFDESELEDDDIEEHLKESSKAHLASKAAAETTEAPKSAAEEEPASAVANEAEGQQAASAVPNVQSCQQQETKESENIDGYTQKKEDLQDNVPGIDAAGVESVIDAEDTAAVSNGLGDEPQDAVVIVKPDEDAVVNIGDKNDDNEEYNDLKQPGAGGFPNIAAFNDDTFKPPADPSKDILNARAPPSAPFEPTTDPGYEEFKKEGFDNNTELNEWGNGSDNKHLEDDDRDLKEEFKKLPNFEKEIKDIFDNNFKTNESMDCDNPHSNGNTGYRLDENPVLNPSIASNDGVTLNVNVDVNTAQSSSNVGTTTGLSVNLYGRSIHDPSALSPLTPNETEQNVSNSAADVTWSQSLNDNNDNDHKNEENNAPQPTSSAGNSSGTSSQGSGVDGNNNDFGWVDANKDYSNSGERCKLSATSRTAFEQQFDRKR